ncbi:MAG: NAD(P)-dependent oxidoreductase [Candidatus Dormibacteraeota bacterium]|nr:NAD(P)-dependent oxidoreductase [Candidatus Dormibacteraeota bacterium]
MSGDLVPGTALVTGASGFTGTHVCRALAAEGWKVVALVRPAGAERRRARPEPDDQTARVPVDLLDREAVRVAVIEASPDRIVHLAGLRGPAALPDLLTANVTATDHVLSAALELLRDREVRVLVPGSAAEYGDSTSGQQGRRLQEGDALQPLTAYGVSKVAQVCLAQRYHRTEGVPVYLARPFNIVGAGEPSDLVCSSLARQMVGAARASGSGQVVVNSTERVRDFTDVRDVASAYLTILHRGDAGVVYNVCTGIPRAIGEVIDILATLTGCRATVRRGAASTSGDVRSSVGDPSRINEIGWQARVPLRASLHELVDEWRVLSSSEQSSVVDVGAHQPGASLRLSVRA